MEQKTGQNLGEQLHFGKNKEEEALKRKKQGHLGGLLG